MFDEKEEDLEKEEEEVIHMGILGLLCEKLGIPQLKNPKVTMRPKEVTCEKCIKILKERKILK